MLIQVAIRSGLRIDEGFRLQERREQLLDLICTPFRFLPPMLRQLVARVRTRAAKNTKSINMTLAEIDEAATRASAKKLTKEELGAV